MEPTTPEKVCFAFQYSDSMYCHYCGLTWDMNDLDPPKCRRSWPRCYQCEQKVSYINHRSRCSACDPHLE